MNSSKLKQGARGDGIGRIDLGECLGGSMHITLREEDLTDVG